MKNVADGLKYALKWVLYTWTQGPIPPNLGELTEWISVLLKMLTCLESQTFRGKWAENRPGILCLFGFFCFSIFLSFFYFSFCVCVCVCVCVFFFETKIFVLIHMRLNGRVSDEKSCIRPTFGIKTTFFFGLI